LGVDFPDGYYHFGRTTVAELLSFFAHLAEGKSLAEARRKVGWIDQYGNYGMQES